MLDFLKRRATFQQTAQDLWRVALDQLTAGPEQEARLVILRSWVNRGGPLLPDATLLIELLTVRLFAVQFAVYISQKPQISSAIIQHLEKVIGKAAADPSLRANLPPVALGQYRVAIAALRAATIEASHPRPAQVVGGAFAARLNTTAASVLLVGSEEFDTTVKLSQRLLKGRRLVAEGTSSSGISVPVTAGEGWELPKITDYWDDQTKAVERYSRRLEQLEATDRAAALAAIRSAVLDRSRALSEEHLAMVGWIVADDLYKAVAHLTFWNEALVDYLAASARTLYQELASNQIAVEYVVDNFFEPTPVGLAGPCRWFPLWFATAGFTYVCPQHQALRELAHDTGEIPAPAIARLPELIALGRQRASDLVAQCRAAHRHFVFLDTDSEPDHIVALIRKEPAEGVVFAFRNDPPHPGTKCRVIPLPGVQR